MQCPQCRYLRRSDDGGPDTECPRCGIIYAKFDPKVGQKRDELRKVAERRLYKAAVVESARINAEEQKVKESEIVRGDRQYSEVLHQSALLRERNDMQRAQLDNQILAGSTESSASRKAVAPSGIRLIFSIVVLGLALASTVWFYRMQQGGGTAGHTARDKIVFAGRDAVVSRLKDPGSASFRSGYVGKDNVSCGEVNAKNSFGGYVGFKRYIAGTLIVILESDMEPEEFDKVWFESCR